MSTLTVHQSTSQLSIPISLLFGCESSLIVICMSLKECKSNRKGMLSDNKVMSALQSYLSVKEGQFNSDNAMGRP